jgi:hypothetical protein
MCHAPAALNPGKDPRIGCWITTRTGKCIVVKRNSSVSAAMKLILSSRSRQ